MFCIYDRAYLIGYTRYLDQALIRGCVRTSYKCQTLIEQPPIGLVWIYGQFNELFLVKDVKHCYISASVLLARLLCAHAVLACCARWVHDIGNQVSDSDGAGSDTASHQGLVQISGLPKEICSIKDVKHWYFSAFLLHAPCCARLLCELGSP